MRGQATLEAMLMLAASVAMVAALSPAYRSAFELSVLSQKNAQAQQAANALSSASSIAAAAGEGSTFSGDIFIPENTTVVRSAGGVALRLLASYGKFLDFPVSETCSLSINCEGPCAFTARGGVCAVEIYRKD